jgi:hypothetical protein
VSLAAGCAVVARIETFVHTFVSAFLELMVSVFDSVSGTVEEIQRWMSTYHNVDGRALSRHIVDDLCDFLFIHFNRQIITEEVFSTSHYFIPPNIQTLLSYLLSTFSPLPPYQRGKAEL